MQNTPMEKSGTVLISWAENQNRPRFSLGEEDLAVVAPRNEVVAAPVKQLAWWSGHGD